ncbi:PucR family transcriptional regulator [Bacillus xiapuensis]|uniref:PucR family transcriptional regulator n=1 Tax=Bacillus xiapuensis TaxID=2014075 RepID=UPI0012FD9DD0|nr:helix-turn-helix domain-containing protein [Bacillus xiapuensis]
MLKKLQSYFPTAIATSAPPSLFRNDLIWFKDDNSEPLWLGIPKAEMIEEQFELLSALYECVSPRQNKHLSNSAMEWYSFLFEEKNTPKTVTGGTQIRFIQFQVTNHDQCIKELEEAIKEYFHNSLAFIWLDGNNGLIVEEKSQVSYEEDEFYSISITLENEFYILAKFYIGKYRNPDLDFFRKSYFLERELFIEARRNQSGERVFSFERILPVIVSASLPQISKTILNMDLIPLLREDPELRRTIQGFLEHNSNATLAAKKLHVHRNTLQYRMDKFTEKTGINLKDFQSSLTIYLACLMSKGS